MKQKILYVVCYFLIWILLIIPIYRYSYIYLYADYNFSMLTVIAFTIWYTSLSKMLCGKK